MNDDENYDVTAEQRRCDRVIIAAAVAALFGRPAVIPRLRVLAGFSTGAWLREGRLAIQVSHRMPAAGVGMALDRRMGNL